MRDFAPIGPLALAPPWCLLNFFSPNLSYITQNCELIPLLMFSQTASLAKFVSSTNLQLRVSNHLSLLSL